MLISLIPNLFFAQGINCAGATPVTINGTCITNVTISNSGNSGPASTCGAVVREGWYTFTVSGGPSSFTIQATADRNLAIQLLSSTSSCTGLTAVSCTNVVGDQGTGFGTETVTTTLSNGIYYIKILNVGGNNNMILQSLCVKSCNLITNNLVTYSNGTSGQLSATAAERGTAVLSGPPAGTYFATVNFASYGTPNGTAPTFTYGPCHSATSQSVTEGFVLGSTGPTSIPATNAVFGDPCGGTGKKLNILASYAQPICTGGSISITGTTPTGGNGTYSYEWQSSTTSATSGFGNAVGTNNGVNYTSGVLTQDTWFRRIVKSCSDSSTSAVVLVKVTTNPTVITNPVSLNISAVTNTSFTVAASNTPTSYTWQVSTNGGGNWTTVTNGGVYSNATTATLNITGATLAMNGFLYRASATNTCGTSPYSTAATLNVNKLVLVSGAGINNVNCGENSILKDHAGDSDYGNNRNDWSVINAGLGSTITLSGTYTTESNYDYIRIYSGSGITGALLYTYSGNGTINVTGNPGQTLTVRFTSDTSRNFSGFNLNVSYSGLCSAVCATPTAQPTSLVLTSSSNSISGSFTAASPAPSNYLVVMNTTGVAPTPVNSTDYTIGSTALGGTNVVIDTDSNTSFSANSLTQLTTYYFFIYSMNSLCTGGTKYLLSPGPLNGNATTTSFNYCTPTVATPSNTFITDVRFLGTLNDVANNNNGNGTNGYQNFTGLPNKTIQAAGEGINVFVQSNGVDTVFKAWVDWNRDGLFNNIGPVTPSSELVFTSGETRAISTTFGIVIPPGTNPGNYTMRIRNYRYKCTVTESNPGGYCADDYFNSCTNFTNPDYGETEDYIITVLQNCSANIVSPVTTAVNCGPGILTLSAKGNSGTTKLRWYDAETGGNLLSEIDVDSSISGSFTTPFITSTTVYYVTAFNGTCESIFRRPVVAKIRPVPSITFDLPLADANFCGDENTLKLNSSGDKEEVILFEEDFETKPLLPLMGKYFTASTGSLDNSNTTNTGWQNQTSTFKPSGAIWSPAISSGFGGNKFAYTTSDYSYKTVESILTSTASYDTAGFNNLKLTFSAFYSYYGDTSAAAGGTVESFFVEVSKDNGTSWIAVQTNDSSIGYGTRFEPKIINLDSSYLNITNLKVRFRYLAYWADGVSIDNIKLFGDKPLSTSFVWNAPNIGIYNANCSTPYVDGTPTSSVCIKPTDDQLQTIANWNISAEATLGNGCKTTGVITVKNNNKVWDTAQPNWHTENWQPTGAVPDLTKCVLIKQPVTVISGTNGFAKVVKIESAAGKLTLNGDASLTIQNGLVNNAGINNVILESDSNLKQNSDNPIPVNFGSVTAKRNITFRSNTSREEYNYLISPVVGQSLKTIYPNVPTTATYPYILYHNETNNYFYNSSGAHIPGRGLAVKEPSVAHVAAGNMDAEFKGPLANGIINYPLAFTDMVTHGYNLVGNPYASNIDLQLLYGLNTGAITSTFYFWNNGANDKYQQMGSDYSGRAYAVYNATSDIGNEAGYLLQSPLVLGTKKPIKITKVGQGFMVRAMSAGKTLVFKNSIRVTDNTDVKFFSKKADSTANRYWLRLITPANLVNTIAVVHFNQGSNTFGMDDSELNSATSDMLYSMVEDHQLQIDGKPSFVDTDKIILGTQHYVAGDYTFALGDKEGIFDQGQNIYLKDNQTGTVSNLSEGDYTFAANAGASTGRFEIIYRPEIVLVTDTRVKEGIIVYRDKDDFVIRSPKTMSVIQVYDASGKLITVLKPNGKEGILDVAGIANGMYVLKITTTDGEVMNKKIAR